MKRINIIFIFIFFNSLTYGFDQKVIGLLTKDYDVLTKKDLQPLDDEVPAEFFNAKEQTAFALWKCWEISTVKLNIICEDMEMNEPGVQYGSLDIQINETELRDVYGQRRAYPMDACYRDKKAIEELLKEQKVFCIRGFFINKNQEKKEIYDWIIDRVKTKKGCWSYFENDCL